MMSITGDPSKASSPVTTTRFAIVLVIVLVIVIVIEHDEDDEGGCVEGIKRERRS